MTLSTEIAREPFLYGKAGGKRVTSVKALAVKGSAVVVETQIPAVMVAIRARTE